MIHTLSRPIRQLLTAVLLLPIAGTAFAHHPLDGATPTSFANGLLSGLGHPVIELDHFVFLLAVVILAWVSGARWRMVASLIVGASLGVLFGIGGWFVPGFELLITASLVAAGVFLVYRRIPTVLLAVFAAVAGLLHGLAYSETVIGAEPTPMIAYVLGLAICQFVIAAVVLKCLDSRTPRNAPASVVCGVTAAVVVAVAALPLLPGIG